MTETETNKPNKPNKTATLVPTPQYALTSDQLHTIAAAVEALDALGPGGESIVNLGTDGDALSLLIGFDDNGDFGVLSILMVEDA